MTTVVVTRDANGIQIWKPGTDVQLVHADFSASTDFWGKRWISKTPVWVSHGFFKLLFNEKQCEQWFPELYTVLSLNERRDMQLQVTVA